MDIIARYKNQRISQLIHFKNREPGSHPERLENCHRLKTKTASQVTLKKKPGAEKAHYSGVQTCGSVHACSVCSSIISERRKIMLQKGIDTWRAYDPCNTVTMVTYTTPHYLFQTLSEVLTIQDQAIRIMKKQPQKGAYKVWRTIMDEMASIGSYTNRENTFGLNGWHTHRHEVLFNVLALEKRLLTWRNDLVYAFGIAFKKAGGVINNYQAFHERAVRLDQITDDDGFKRISAYITTVEGDTWTLAAEATKGGSKTAKNGNITPFGMLQAIRQGDPHSGLYSIKFYEYAKTMKGKKQLFPSAGLNHFLGLNWKSDDEIMKESTSGNDYGILTDDEHKQILDFDIRGEVIEATRGDSEGFKNRLYELLKEYALQKSA